MENKPLLDKLRDPKFYLENFTKIQGKKAGSLIPFKLNEAQKDLFNAIKKFNRIIILKSRQGGFSTAVVGWIFHKTITTPGTTSAIIGYNADLTSELLQKIKIFLKTIPEELRPTVEYNSKYEISFPSLNSKILVLPSTVNVGRGYTLQNILATELAFWEDAEEKMMTLEASVPIDGKIIIESTPRGQGTEYHRKWMDETNGYEKKMYGWWWTYTQEEIDLIEKRMNNPMMFAQEYGCRFLSSGRNVFDQTILETKRKDVLRIGDKRNDIDFTVYEWDKLRIYREPEVGHSYVIGADVSEGVEGGDYSTAIIWDRKTGEEVAMFRGYIPPDLYAGKLDRWGRKYNNALMVVEVNNHGLTTITALKNLVYPSMYFRPSKLETVASQMSDKLGWRTTRGTKDFLIDDFAQAIRDGDLTIHSKELLDEMTVFVYNDAGNITPLKNFHDDLIFGAAIGLQGFKVLSDRPLDQIAYENYFIH
jgi:hypothetical protein